MPRGLDVRIEMGRFLKKKREERKVTQRSVGIAIHRGSQYVSEVERGVRGANMDPYTAVLWAMYLGFDPSEFFHYLGFYRGKRELMDAARHYIQTSIWATFVLRARQKCEALQRKLRALKADNADIQLDYQVEEAISLCQEAVDLLSVPRRGDKKEG